MPVAAHGRRGSRKQRAGEKGGAGDADQQRLFDAPTLSALPGPPATLEAAAPSFSVSALVSYRRCPRQYYWTAVRPLPRQASAAARIGTALHRWIEQRSDPQLPLLEHGFSESGDNGEPPGRAVLGLRAAFLASPFAQLEPVRVEAPFVLVVGGQAVRGRIDAVYRRAGRAELVDFKTGSPPEDADPAATTQLDLYAIAACDVWGERPASLRTTYCYLGDDGTFRLTETDWDDDRLARAREDLSASLAGLAAGHYRAAPGGWCARCEWREACGPGRALLKLLPQMRDHPA
jgi:RecB family exonuclease